MTKTLDFEQQMRIYDALGQRLYLNADERSRFLDAAREETREYRVMCHVMHYTGCRSAELIGVSPARIHIDEVAILFQSAKKHKRNRKGEIKPPVYRQVEIPERLLDDLDLVFDLRARLRTGNRVNDPLWPITRVHVWRIIKRVMTRAGIEGPQATAKGLRHGFGIAMLTGDRPPPLHIVADLLGHASTKTTAIYTQATGEERRKMVMQAWD
ncbi:MAG: tyrosine-type recombinase/integrase [Gammaproteobacteria bacterium]|nr:tyrosine-type recombinase/integrase [Gammaproteobacteria bacterium]